MSAMPTKEQLVDAFKIIEQAEQAALALAIKHGLSIIEFVHVSHESGVVCFHLRKGGDVRGKMFFDYEGRRNLESAMVGYERLEQLIVDTVKANGRR